jgi:hypothetical protein
MCGRWKDSALGGVRDLRVFEKARSQPRAHIFALRHHPSSCVPASSLHHQSTAPACVHLISCHLYIVIIPPYLSYASPHFLVQDPSISGQRRVSINSASLLQPNCDIISHLLGNDCLKSEGTQLYRAEISFSGERPLASSTVSQSEH